MLSRNMLGSFSILHLGVPQGLSYQLNLAKQALSGENAPWDQTAQYNPPGLNLSEVMGGLYG